jgi:hypothetical protein
MGVAITKGWKHKPLFKIHFVVKGTGGANQTNFSEELLIKCPCDGVVKASARELYSQP